MTFFNIIRGSVPLMSIVMLIFILGGSVPVTAGQSNKVFVFAAASTTNAIQEIGQLFSQKNKARCVSSFASSSTLAKQIDAGAPANVYISANPRWMDFLDGKGLIETGTRYDILGNRIVLIAPAASDLHLDILPGFALPEIMDGEKISMGDPEHVPAGIYGRQALESLGVWDEIAPKVVRAKDVRTALVFVERGEAPLGIVYATDAAITDKVKVVGIFPENSHPPVIYQAAIVRGNKTKVALAFFRFLKSPEAAAVFEAYGFSVK
jgi:molybdate transport system substrate-binding protein